MACNLPVQTSVSNSNPFNVNVIPFNPSLITITGVNGISGGGDLTASRTLGLDINSLTLEASPDGAADYVVIYDASAGTERKVLLNNLPSSAGGETNTYSSAGVGGVAITLTKTGVDFPFKSINSSSISGIAISDDVANSEVDISLDINSLTTTTADTAADYIVIYDTSIAEHRKVLLQDIGADKHYEHVQGVASATWNIAHGLNKYPSVSIVDSSGNIVIGDTNYVDVNNVTLTFAGAFAGKAYLN